jgi:hypothetical protein
MVKMLTAVAVALAIVACAMPREARISQAAAAQFKEGVSTEAEIVAKLGKPTDVSVSGGNKVMNYVDLNSAPASGDGLGTSVTSKTASFEIDSTGTLLKMTYSEQTTSRRM